VGHEHSAQGLILRPSLPPRALPPEPRGDCLVPTRDSPDSSGTIPLLRSALLQTYVAHDDLRQQVLLTLKRRLVSSQPSERVLGQLREDGRRLGVGLR
jgi:hypothetical protein